MRIAILGSYPVHPFADELNIELKSVTRITSWNEKLADELSKLSDSKVYVITTTNALNTTRTITKDNLTVTYIPANKWSNRLTLYQHLRFKTLKLLNDFKPDIVHGIGTEHIWPYIAVNSKYPSIVTIHGIISEVVKKSPPKRFSQQRFFSWLEPRVLRKTKHLISISPYITDTLSKYTSARCYSIENPIREIFFETTAAPSSGKYMLFVGSIEHRKGVHNLIDALGILKESKHDINLKMILAGPILNSDYGELLKSKIEFHKLDKAIEFAGFMMPDELAIKYSNAAFLILPSYEETAPMCIAEAMSVGIPVIATNVGGIEHMITHGETGYIVKPGDIHDLADRILYLSNDLETRSKMGERAKQIATDRWLPDIIADKTLNVYQSIINT